MAVRALAFLLLGLLLGGCMQAARMEQPPSDVGFTARDKKLLANPPYAQATIPAAYQRQIVDYHRAEAPGSIVIDTDTASSTTCCPRRRRSATA